MDRFAHRVTLTLGQNRFAFLLGGLVLLCFYGAAADVVSAHLESVFLQFLVGTTLAYMIVAATFAVGGRGRSFWLAGVAGRAHGR